MRAEIEKRWRQGLAQGRMNSGGISGTRMPRKEEFLSEVSLANFEDKNVLEIGNGPVEVSAVLKGKRYMPWMLRTISWRTAPVLPDEI